jgi:hypothetical protein
MASRDTLASVHAYSGIVTYPFSGTWAQADLQHIGEIYRGLTVGPTVPTVYQYYTASVYCNITPTVSVYCQPAPDVEVYIG